MGISGTPDGNTGWKVTAACQWRTGGKIPLPISVWLCPLCLPSPSSGYPLTPTHSYTLGLLSQSRSFTATRCSGRLCRCFTMTHCAAGAKRARVCAAALVRALRSRLKSLGCLLLRAGSDASCQRPARTFSSGQGERPGLLNRKMGGAVLDCCGPARPSLTVSSNV